MSAWYDLTVALGGAAVPDSTKRVPMARERAAEVIQYAFKKWLVSYRNKKFLGYDPSSHTSLRLSGGGGAGKYRQGISTTAITISTTAVIVTTTTVGIDVAADDAVAATAADVAVAATATDVTAATAATAADTVADTGIATSMSPSLVLAGMAPRARVPAGLLGSWVTWWRRLVKVKRAARVTVRRMHQRQAIRSARRTLASWAAAAARVAGARRLVTARVAAVQHRRGLARVLRAWVAATLDTKQRKRALARASTRLRVVWMRAGRRALQRWRELVRAKRCHAAATTDWPRRAELTTAVHSQSFVYPAVQSNAVESVQNGVHHGHAISGGARGFHKEVHSWQALTVGAVSTTLIGWTLAWSALVEGTPPAQEDLVWARENAAALGAAGEACGTLRDADAEEFATRMSSAAARENVARAASQMAFFVEKESTGSALADAVAKVEQCDIARYAAADAHTRVMDAMTVAEDGLRAQLSEAVGALSEASGAVVELKRTLSEASGAVVELERAAAAAAVTSFRLPSLSGVAPAIAPYVAAIPNVTLSVEPVVVASALLSVLILVVLVGVAVVAGMARQLQIKSAAVAQHARDAQRTRRNIKSREGENRFSSEIQTEELAVWRASGMKLRAQVEELESELKAAQSFCESEIAAVRQDKDEAARDSKRELDARLAELVAQITDQSQKEREAVVGTMRELTAAAQQAETDVAAADARTAAAIAAAVDAAAAAAATELRANEKNSATTTQRTNPEQILVATSGSSRGSDAPSTQVLSRPVNSYSIKNTHRDPKKRSQERNGKRAETIAHEEDSNWPASSDDASPAVVFDTRHSVFEELTGFEELTEEGDIYPRDVFEPEFEPRPEPEPEPARGNSGDRNVSLAGATHPATKGKTSMIRSLASSMSMTRGRSTTKGTVVTKSTSTTRSKSIMVYLFGEKKKKKRLDSGGVHYEQTVKVAGQHGGYVNQAAAIHDLKPSPSSLAEDATTEEGCQQSLDPVASLVGVLSDDNTLDAKHKGITRVMYTNVITTTTNVTRRSIDIARQSIDETRQSLDGAPVPYYGHDHPSEVHLHKSEVSLSGWSTPFNANAHLHWLKKPADVTPSAISSGRQDTYPEPPPTFSGRQDTYPDPSPTFSGCLDAYSKPFATLSGRQDAYPDPLAGTSERQDESQVDGSLMDDYTIDEATGGASEGFLWTTRELPVSHWAAKSSSAPHNQSETSEVAAAGGVAAAVKHHHAFASMEVDTIDADADAIVTLYLDLDADEEDERTDVGDASVSGIPYPVHISNSAKVEQGSETPGPAAAAAVRHLLTDVDVLNTWREQSLALMKMWPEARSIAGAATWEGVMIDEHGEWGDAGCVLALELDAKFKFSTLPSEVLMFTGLKELLLSDNGLRHIPTEITLLIELEVLEISNNPLTEVPPELGHLTALKELSLDNNKLTRVPPELGGLLHLQKLDLSSNQLSNVPAALGTIASLQMMDLQYNLLTSVPQSIGLGKFALEVDEGVTMEAAEEDASGARGNTDGGVNGSDGNGTIGNGTIGNGNMEIGNMEIGNYGDTIRRNSGNCGALSPPISAISIPADIRALLEWRTGCPALQAMWPAAAEVDDDTGFFGVEFGEDDDVDRVVGIRLENVGLTGELPCAIGRLDALRDLDLGFNRLTWISPDIGNLRSLVSLSLFNNLLTRLPDEIGNLQALKTLELRQNQLVTLPAALGQLTDLQTLYLSQTSLTSVPAEVAGLASFQFPESKKVPELNAIAGAVSGRPASAAAATNPGKNEMTKQSADLDALFVWRRCCPQLLDLWPDSGDCTEWEGVTFDEASTGRVIHIALSAKQLSGELPPEFGRLDALESLHLASNDISGLPAEIGRLTCLKELDIGGNLLTQLPPELGHCRRLEVLCLDKNQLTVVPKELGDLADRLEVLQLSRNLLTEVPPELGRLTALIELHLGRNALTVVPPELGNLTALQWLDVRGNRLTALPAELGQLIELTKLHMGRNMLQSVPTALGALTQLRELDLTNNQLDPKAGPAAWVPGGELEKDGCKIAR